MKETWRWYGPEHDPIPLEHVKQTGTAGVVSALHHIYGGEAWPVEEVLRRKAQIQAAGLEWSVVESIPVHNSIKLRSGPFRKYIGAWKDSLAAIAKAGVPVVCYNFMPVVDWTRTDLMWKLPTTGYALRFDAVDFAAYDLFILARAGAEGNYPASRVAEARVRFAAMTQAKREELERNVIAGLPASESSYDREAIRRTIAEYDGMTPDGLRAHLAEFIREIAPVAEELGIRLGIHPDDPPWSLFGLPRIVSTAEDARAILAASDSSSNGLTFCVGSYGSRGDNDLVAMVKEFAQRIHFVHLRQVAREADGSFNEAEHLNGTSDMVGVIHAMLQEEQRRRRAGRADWEVPMRPDHGHLLADDIGKKVNPGYSLIGRMKGLAELRGVSRGLLHALPELGK